MSDFKFPCPKCGQNILSDTSNAGMQIACPACQTSITVPKPPPAAPVAARLSIAKHAAPAPSAPPPPGAANAPTKPTWGAKPVAAAPKKMSVLAIVSFVCSLLGSLGCLPAIICGHLARARIARDSSLKGKGFTTAGLILGYLSLVLTIGWFTAGKPYLEKIALEEKQKQEAAARQAAEEQKAAAEAAEKAKRARASYSLDLANVNYPERHASGKLHGVDFSVEAAVFQGGNLTLRQESGDARQFVIALPLKYGESFPGKSFAIEATNTLSQPRVALNWRDASGGPPGNQSFFKGYAMKLEFGATTDGNTPGKIFLCVPDAEQSFVAGDFVVGPRKVAAPAQPAAQSPAAMRRGGRRELNSGGTLPPQ